MGGRCQLLSTKGHIYNHTSCFIECSDLFTSIHPVSQNIGMFEVWSWPVCCCQREKKLNKIIYLVYISSSRGTFSTYSVNKHIQYIQRFIYNHIAIFWNIGIYSKSYNALNEYRVIFQSYSLFHSIFGLIYNHTTYFLVYRDLQSYNLFHKI